MAFHTPYKALIMKQVYSNESSFLANNVKNLLEEEGITTFIKNEFAQGAIGEIPVFDVWPEVWIANDADFEHATALINSLQHNTSGVDWVCSHCAEENDASFELCWKCQHVNP
jgi:hypothetical protein